MRTFAIGDMHGGHKALVQCLERSKFDYEEDLLIVLGDIADGWPEVPECVDELLKVKNKIIICGNHDKWCADWFMFGKCPMLWTEQGGKATMEAYITTGKLLEEDHKKFWYSIQNFLFYYDEKRNYLFVHGGFDWRHPLERQPQRYANGYSNLYWDRHMWETAKMLEKRGLDPQAVPSFVRNYEMVFIGHTTTTFDFGHTDPVKCLNVYNLDQGAGYEGKLTIMDIDTFEYWQSDLVNTLYPNFKGRN
jgi:serine/threonine protein phosphatase 1